MTRIKPKETSRSYLSNSPLEDFILPINKLLKDKIRIACAVADWKVPSNPENGDLALALHKISALQKISLSELESLVKSKLEAKLISEGMVEKIKVDGWYLNLYFNQEKLAERIIERILTDSDYGKNEVLQGKKIIIEFSSPNTNKPLHLGHVRNNALGMALSNLLEKVGAKVVCSSIVNDRGVHISKSMWAYQKFGKGQTPSSTGIKGDLFVGRFYVKFEQELNKEKERYTAKLGIDLANLRPQEKESVEKKFYQQSQLQKEVWEMLKLWEAGDEKIRALWKKMNRWVENGFEETYRLLGSRFDKNYYESDTYQLGKDIVGLGLKNGIFKKRADGATVAKLKNNQEKVLLRPDGTSVYITQDIGVAKLKYDEFRFDQSLYVVGSEQNYYFTVLFEILNQLKYPWTKQMRHLSYGLVELPEGKMKSREGNVVDADELIASLTQMAQIKLTQLDGRRKTESQRQNETARAVTLGAIKYHFLKTNPQTRVIFDPSKSLDFEGMTGPYLQYTTARINGILEKAGKTAASSKNWRLLKTPQEQAIIKSLAVYPGAIQESIRLYNPSILANYLGNLGQEFNRWYHRHPVLKAEKRLKSARLDLVQAVLKVLSDGLKILGIKPLEKM